MKKQSWVERVVSVDFGSVDTRGILDIYRYLMKETWYKKMFGFIKKIWVCTIGSFSELLVSNSKRPTKYLTLNNQPFPARQTLVNINSYETLVSPIYC